MGMISEFRDFINKGSVLDLAVGVIIGAAFGKLVTALTDDFISPILSIVTGGIDFNNMYVPIGSVPDGTPATLEAMKTAGVPVFAYGHFIGEVIAFLITAWVIFMIVKAANKAMPKAPEAPPGPSEVDLLTEIRDALKK